MFLPLSRIAIAGALFLAPVTAAAGTLTAEDSIAGVGVTVSLTNFAAQESVEVVLTTPEGTSHSFTTRTNAEGAGSLAVAGRFAEKTGTYLLLTPQAPSKTTAVNIEPDSMDPRTSALQVLTPRIAADGKESAAITVTLRDRYGNPLPGRAASVLASRTSDAVTALSPETDAQGIQHFSLTTNVPGQSSLRAIDLLSGAPLSESAIVEAVGAAIGGQSPSAYTSPYTAQTSTNGRFFYAQMAPTFDVIDHFEVEAPAIMQPGVEAQKLIVRAVDRSGQTVENYVGTVRFSSTDPLATLPNFGTYTFRERDLGSMTFALALKFRTSGEQTFRVEDANDDRIAGTVTVQVGGSNATPGSDTIEITSHKNEGYINSANIIIEGRGPRFANVIVMGGPEDALASTDENGFFSVAVSLNPAQKDHTIRVRDESGRNDSGPVHLILDQNEKEISIIQFAPEKPDAGAQVLVIVQSVPNLAQVVMRLPTENAVQETVLAENTAQPGTYQGFFVAPVAGTYQPSILATDQAGNLTEVRTTLSVTSTQLPQVQNVRIESREESLTLYWDAASDTVTGYRIYIGDGPENFVYTLDTGGPVTQAIVRGLLPGQTYYFAVTALRDALESTEKSTVVMGQTLNISLDIIPAENALQVQWTAIATDLPLSSFLLEYGVEENALTEQRMFNGELRDVTLHDLIPGVLYYFRLTPITVSGEKLMDLAIEGQGTPGGTGFRPAARDDVPFDVVLHPGAQQTPPPTVNAVGMSRGAWMGAAAFGVISVLWYVRRRQTLRKTDAFLQTMSSRYHS